MKYIIILFLASSCAISSTKDYQVQGRSAVKKLTFQLQKIQDPKSLIDSKSGLKKRYNELTKVLIKFQAFVEKHPEIEVEPSADLMLASVDLKEELLRVYQIEGAIDIIIECQKDALLTLSLFEQSQIKHHSIMKP